MTLTKHLPQWVAAVAVAMSCTAFAQQKEVTFAHQDMLVPLRTVMESGELEKATGINSMKDLVGKKVATPFASTAHYQLMVAMKLDGLDAKTVNVLNLRPPEIAAAWERGDIDAAFIWDPVLSKIKGNGKAIASSKSIGAKGYPTFDGLIVSTKWAAANEGFMLALVKALIKADNDYRTNAAKWTVDSPQVKAVAKCTKADAKDVPAAMALYSFPTAQEQSGPKWLGGGAAKAMTDTAAFLKEQGRIQNVNSNYASFVTDTYVKKALGK